MTIGKLLRATQRGVRFAKDKAVKLGDESPTERAIQDEIDTAKVAKGSRKPSVTQGKASVSNFIKDQMAASPGLQARSKQDNAFARMIKNAKTKKEKEALQEALNKIREKRRRADARAETKRRANISSGSRGKTKEKDNFAIALKAANERGELVPEFDKLTKPQQERIINSAKRKLEEGDPTDIARQMLKKRNPDKKEVKMGKVILGELGKNKGGVIKKRTGAHDFRMNKGGLLLSSVDNRKKK
jgi:hypothetical protein|tara:strand:+ start:322 stop:1053 length:732 start_codon:yes stop_codon:yes gene_type:complete